MTGGNDARADGQGRVYQASGDQHITEHHHHGPDWSGPDSVRRPAVGRAPVVLRDRTEEMRRLRAALEPGVGNRVYVLHGLGGCGKTAVAYTLFDHATHHAGRIGLWVNASDPASLRAGMLAVAADRGATDAELMGARSGLRPAADLVWQCLDHSDQPWLLVLDNADNPAILRDGGWLRTSPAGIVVVTSRQAAARWWPGAELLHVGVLPRDEAALVLRDLAPHAGTVDEAALVADRLGRLPLALTLAGGFLAHQVIDPWTLADYGHQLDGGDGRDPIELIDQGALDTSESRHLLSRTWQLSLDALAGQGLPEANSLLRLLACWANDPLPVTLLSGAEVGSDLPVFRIESALRGLLDQSLTELLPEGVSCLRTHGVLLDSVARTIPSDQREQLAATAARQLKATLPENPERVAHDPHINLLAPHVLALLRRVVDWSVAQSVVEEATECSLRLVIALHRDGDFSSALAAADRAVELAKQCLPEDHPLVLRLRQRAGRALYRLGRFEEAEVLHRQVLEACERSLGSAALDTLESCLGLSRALWQLGREPEAMQLIWRAIAGRNETLGPVHPLTLIAKAYVSEVAPGPELDEEVAMGQTLVADCYRTVGEQHSITLLAELDQADLLRRAGRNAEALPTARRALAAHEQRYGGLYPITLAARTLLSNILAELGRYAEAIEQMETVVNARTDVLGTSHPWTVWSEGRLDEYRRLLSQP
ncbi:tetratricopeptide repeat protein [Streptomyces bauhiniae]|uniref:Tetratricopeptide repeat protein n=1 Tax=Streptomyces bauhiniae TaxID=2340725 RepID=A0A4Z1DET0_9ACTN|nr:tetratricopeptide repeat protein [Streptomyces bauhiniae]TGN81706.1 tetratricopeptide repeat protein [Streptomyces bauhiniae]